jgi:hypothetical protein
MRSRRLIPAQVVVALVFLVMTLLHPFAVAWPSGAPSALAAGQQKSRTPRTA